MKKYFLASATLALLAPIGAWADTASDIQALRAELDAVRKAYEARLQALEQRLIAAESQAAPGKAPNTTQAPSAAVAPANANSLNPAISMVLSGTYSRTSRDPADYRISGFQLPSGAEVGPGTRGFSLAETELSFSANIDPWLRGVTHIALHPDNAVSVEEAYVQTTSLGSGLSLKAGRFLSGVGYLNSQHAHTWDFVDAPLAYQALLGTQLGDDGVQLKWIAPTDQYIELGAELARGRSFPGSGNSRNGAGMASLGVHTGGDIGESHSWRAGVSVLSAKADGQALDTLNSSGTAVGNSFTGKTRLWIADGVWKWAPNGNASRTSFKLQGEYLRSTARGELVYDATGAAIADGYRAVQSGWYVQGVYQFMPRWRLGLRTERLSPGTPYLGINASALSGTGYQPRKNSLMLDFNPSEFSRIRLQLASDQARDGRADRQLFIQYQMSLGAHGAHGF